MSQAFIRTGSGNFVEVQHYNYASASLALYVSLAEKKVFNCWGGEVVPDNGSFRFKSPRGTFEGRFIDGEFQLRQRAVFHPQSAASRAA